MEKIYHKYYIKRKEKCKGILRVFLPRLKSRASNALYGDNIQKSSELVGPDKWYTELDIAKKFVAAVNRHGGDATLVELPKIGLTGNTHFLMSDLNNDKLADLMAKWLHEKGLDK